jgi:hypothetical protein
MADVRSQKQPPDVSIVNEIARQISDPKALDDLTHLYLSLEAVRQQARTLSEEVRQRLAKLGLPSPFEEF